MAPVTAGFCERNNFLECDCEENANGENHRKAHDDDTTLQNVTRQWRHPRCPAQTPNSMSTVTSSTRLRVVA
jgi:hypothetical protein